MSEPTDNRPITKGYVDKWFAQTRWITQNFATKKTVGSAFNRIFDTLGPGLKAQREACTALLSEVGALREEVRVLLREGGHSAVAAAHEQRGSSYHAAQVRHSDYLVERERRVAELEAESTDKRRIAELEAEVSRLRSATVEKESA